MTKQPFSKSKHAHSINKPVEWAENTPEFSRRIRIEEIAGDGIIQTLTSTPDERAALAARFGIRAIHALMATVSLRHSVGPSVLVEGSFKAKVEQACVITLEPVKSAIASQFSVRYMSAGIGVGAEDGDEFDPLGEDVELLPADAIDVGELVAQYLSLAIDPYPRAAGAESSLPEPEAVDVEEPPKRPNPFAVLKKLQDGA